jgi:hypothetical protein
VRPDLMKPFTEYVLPPDAGSSVSSLLPDGLAIPKPCRTASACPADSDGNPAAAFLGRAGTAPDAHAAAARGCPQRGSVP